MIRRLLWMMIGLAALLVASGASAEPRQRVAILPIKVHALQSNGDYLRAGVADMLASRLGRQDGVGVIRVEDPAAATNDAAAAREAGLAVGADWVVFGSFTRFGEGASLDVACVRTSGDGGADPRSIFVQSGTIGDIIPKLDQVAEKMAVHIQGRASTSPDVAAGQATATPDVALDEAMTEIDALRSRVDALEASVFESGAVERDFSKPALAEN